MNVYATEGFIYGSYLAHTQQQFLWQYQSDNKQTLQHASRSHDGRQGQMLLDINNLDNRKMGIQDTRADWTSTETRIFYCIYEFVSNRI